MSISCVGQYCRWIFFVATALRKRWNLISIYFVREWCDGFFVSYVVPWLSSNIIVGFVWLNSLLLSKVRSQIISCAKLDNATYSVSVDEKAITEWHFDLHDTVELLYTVQVSIRHVLMQYSYCSQDVWYCSIWWICQRSNDRLEFFQLDNYFFVMICNCRKQMLRCSQYNLQ